MHTYYKVFYTSRGIHTYYKVFNTSIGHAYILHSVKYLHRTCIHTAKCSILAYDMHTYYTVLNTSIGHTYILPSVLY